MARKQLIKRLQLLGQSSVQLIADYLQIMELVEPVSIPPTSRDPDDDEVLACALTGYADLIVSGDADLFDLKAFHAIPIVTAAQALVHIQA